MEPLAPKAEVGVLIGRFQVPDLHKAHRDLIDTVLKRHKKVILLLGVSPVKITRNNPLDFMTRKNMIARAYPEVAILPLKDMPSDEFWSKNVDAAITSVFDDVNAVIYGSRDSFIPHYKGRFKTIELAPRHIISGTDIRKMASEEVRTSKDFRAGVIYAAFNKYPTSYQCVDAAIMKGKKELLLGRKHAEGGRWRFIGGFVRPEDTTLEEAVKREAFEETSGMATDGAKYIGSYRIKDWRYESEVDKILTSLFLMEYVYGGTKGSDDMDEVEWFNVADIEYTNVMPSHHILLDALRSYLKLPKLEAEEPEIELLEEGETNEEFEERTKK